MIASILLLGVVWDLLKGLKMVTLMEGGSCKASLSNAFSATARQLLVLLDSSHLVFVSNGCRLLVYITIAGLKNRTPPSRASA